MGNTKSVSVYRKVVLKEIKVNSNTDRGTSALVFKTHNNKITTWKLAEIFESAGTKRKATFHYSRHTFATIALTLKIPKEVIMKLMGIRQERVINIYPKIVDDLVEQEIEKWEMV